jgi:fructose-bisphosphate aldolase class 1
MRITPAILRVIAANAVKSARENAVASLRENSHEDYRPWKSSVNYSGANRDGYTCEFAHYFDASLEGIVDSLQSPRECSSYTTHGPLTAKQARAVLKIARRATAGSVQ